MLARRSRPRRTRAAPSRAIADSVSARSRWTSVSPGASALPSGLRKIFAEDGQRASRALRARQRIGDIVLDRDAVARKLDRGRDQFGERELSRAVFRVREREPGHRAGHADRERGLARLARVGVALLVEEDVARGRGRRGLAIVDRDVDVAVGEVDHHVAAAADIAGARIGHREREAGRDRGIDRVAALAAGCRRRCARRAPPAPPPCRAGGDRRDPSPGNGAARAAPKHPAPTSGRGADAECDQSGQRPAESAAIITTPGAGDGYPGRVSSGAYSARATDYRAGGCVASNAPQW